MQRATRVWGAAVRTGAVLLAVVFLAGACGTSEPEVSQPGTASPASSQPAQKSRDMVAAVSSSGTRGPADLRFSLRARPVVGEPVEIELSMIPTVDVQRLFARFQVSEGLELVSGAETERFDDVAAGTEVTHMLTVIPREDGIFNVSAVVLTDTATESLARTYAIPIIAGAGVPERPAQATPPAAATPAP
jgi:hypothetical protein